MTLAPDTRLGPYEILSVLGVGGMGEVYQALDPRLGRRVALKILPADVAADPDRRDRFEREARAAAALNHPHIVTIHSVEAIDGVRLLTMELVEGKTLAELLPAGGLAVERILAIAIPLADAVSAAHAAGITHRDLKPANVMVTTDGRVKVLDFGLAKLRDEVVPAAREASVPTRALTGEGRIIGTVAYMSTEQAEGKPLDHRSDIFSLGVMLYEMATGVRPFTGDTNLSVLAAIVRDTPRSATALRPDIPAALARIIKRALAKDAERRYQSAKDLRNDLELLREEHASRELTAPLGVARTTTTTRMRRLATVGMLGLVGIGLVTAYRMLADRSRVSDTPTAVAATFLQLTSLPGKEIFPNLTPDGQWVVYSSAADGDEDVYLQSVSGQNAINLTADSPDADREPAFSPDGQHIAFRSDRNGGGIFLMGRTGESVRRVTDEGFLPAWSPDGRQLSYSSGDVEIWPGVFSSGGEIWIVDVQSGRKKMLVRQGTQPTWSPDGRRIAYRSAARSAFSGVWTAAVSDGVAVRATPTDKSAWSPCWSSGGWLYYAGNAGGTFNIWRVRINAETGAVEGAAQSVAAPAPAVGHLAVSADGRRLAYAAIAAHGNVQRAAVDPGMMRLESAATVVTAGSRDWGRMAVSPDGRTLALESGDGSLFVSRADGAGLRQLLDSGTADSPQWTPDGTAILFRSSRSGTGQVWRVDSDGGRLTQVTSEPTGLSVPFVSPDGHRMVAHNHFKNPTDIMVFDLEGHLLESLPPSPVRLESTQWSPDGKRLALGEAFGGLLVYRFDSRRYERILSRGTQPVWATDDLIVFADGPGLSSVSVRTKAVQRILTTAPEVPASPTFSPDHRWLYFVSGLEESDIWMATLK